MPRHNRSHLLAVVLVAVCVSAVLVSPVTADSVTAEDGGTYQISQTLQFTVEHGGDTYDVREGTRSDIGALVSQLRSPDGVATLDTSELAPGTYVLVHGDSGTVEYEFTLEAGDEGESSRDGRADDETPTDQTPAEQVEMVTAEDGGTYHVSETLRFTVERGGEIYDVRKGTTSDIGALVDQVRSPDGVVTLDASGFEPGTYVLLDESGTVEYEFTLEAAGEDGPGDSAEATDGGDRHTDTPAGGPQAGVGQPGFTALVAVLAVGGYTGLLWRRTHR